jgi:hypothetical protein
MPRVPVNPLVFIGVYVAVCAAAFLVGLRLFRTTEPRGDVTVEQLHRFGRLMMMGATVLIVFLAALWVHGDLKAMRA